MNTYELESKLMQINQNFEHHCVMGNWFWTCKKCGRNQRMGNRAELPKSVLCPHCMGISEKPSESSATQTSMF